MSDRYYGSLYSLTPGGGYDLDHLHERVVDAYDHGRSDIDVARELWSLAGDQVRADAIAALVDETMGRDIRVFLPGEVDRLLELMSGLEEALKCTVGDENMVIRPERMSEVRERAKLINVSESRGELAKYALAEGMSRVWAVRDILREARDRELDVGLD